MKFHNLLIGQQFKFVALAEDYPEVYEKVGTHTFRVAGGATGRWSPTFVTGIHTTVQAV